MDASLKAFIIKCYDERIALAPMPEPMRESLKDSNRVPVFLFNLQTRIEELPLRLQTQNTIREATYSLTDWFIEAFIKHAELKLLSDAIKNAAQAKADVDAEKKQIISDAVTKHSDKIVITDEVYDVLKEIRSEEKETGTAD